MDLSPTPCFWAIFKFILYWNQQLQYDSIERLSVSPHQTSSVIPTLRKLFWPLSLHLDSQVQMILSNLSKTIKSAKLEQNFNFWSNLSSALLYLPKTKAGWNQDRLKGEGTCEGPLKRDNRSIDHMWGGQRIWLPAALVCYRGDTQSKLIRIPVRLAQ